MAPSPKRSASAMAANHSSAKKRKGRSKRQDDVDSDMLRLPETIAQDSRLLDLPAEVLQIIIKDFKYPDLCRFTAICSALRNSVSPLRILNTIETFANDYLNAKPFCGTRGMDLGSLNVPAEYDKRDFRALVACKPCYACNQIRPYKYFGTPVSQLWRLPSIRNYHRTVQGHFPRQIRVLSSSIRSFTDRLSRFRLPSPHTECRLCYDCLSKHHRLKNDTKFCRWLVTSDGIVIICKICNVVKKYRHDPVMLSTWQMAEGLCYDCWLVGRRGWMAARIRMDFRLKAMQRECSAIQKYLNWMDNPKSNGPEPGRAFQLVLPRWEIDLTS